MIVGTRFVAVVSLLLLGCGAPELRPGIDRPWTLADMEPALELFAQRVTARAAEGWPPKVPLDPTGRPRVVVLDPLVYGPCIDVAPAELVRAIRERLAATGVVTLEDSVDGTPTQGTVESSLSGFPDGGTLYLVLNAALDRPRAVVDACHVARSPTPPR